MPTAYNYAPALAGAFGSTAGGGAPNQDLLSDDLRVALVTGAYTPDVNAHDFWNDVVANEASGTGYTANGLALSSKAFTLTAANAWGTQWAASTAYTVGQIVRPTTGNGYVYRCVVAGTSAASEPTWPTTPYQTVADGGVTWACVGRNVLQFDAADPSWAGITITFRYAVIYNRTPATDATRPLIWLIDYDSNQSLTNGTLTLTLNALGLGVFTQF